MDYDSQALGLSLMLVDLDMNIYNNMSRNELKNYLYNKLGNISPQNREKVLRATEMLLNNKAENLKEYTQCDKCNCGSTTFPCNLINDVTNKESGTSSNLGSVSGYNYSLDNNYSYDNVLKYKTKTFDEALLTKNDTSYIYNHPPKLNEATFNPQISRLTQPLASLNIFREKSVDGYKDVFGMFDDTYEFDNLKNNNHNYYSSYRKSKVVN
jgi:hypothetical protein